MCSGQTMSFFDRLEGKRGVAARKALPVLLKCAQNRETITYGELGRRIGQHHRQIGGTVGLLGGQLVDAYTSAVGGQASKKMPPIQSLVVNEKTRLPGSGVDWFVKQFTGERIRKAERALLVTAVQESVFEFDWQSALERIDAPFKPAGRMPQKRNGPSKRRSAGESTGRSKRAATNVERTQGDIIDALEEQLASWGFEAHKTRLLGIEPDIIVGERDALIEVKTDDSLNSIYTGVGQLLFYKHSDPNSEPRLVLFANVDPERRDFFVRTAARYGITVIGYRAMNGRVLYNKDALRRAVTG